jgi:hypothetical protein
MDQSCFELSFFVPGSRQTDALYFISCIYIYIYSFSLKYAKTLRIILVIIKMQEFYDSIKRTRSSKDP